MATYTPQEFQEKMYQLYQLDWMMKNGYSLDDAFDVMKELQEHYQDTDEEPTIAEGIQNFQNNKFHGKSFASKEEFMERLKTDVPYMSKLIENSNDPKGLGETYQGFLDRTNPHLSVPPKLRSPEEQEKIFKKIMLDIAKEVCDKTGATLGNDEYIDYDYSDSGDRLSASQIERILKSKDPADELYAIANTTGKFGVDCSFLDEAVTDALENIPQEQADFLEQYVHEHYPKGTSVEFAFREEHPVGIYYDLENSPLLNQEIPVDIIYEPDEKELAPSERYASAPLVLLAKQQGIEKEFRKEVAKRKETAKMDTPRGSQSPKDWTLAECLARENEVRDDGTSKFVFLANLTVKNCIDLLQLQKEERLLGKKAKGTISLPKTVIAGKYDFDGWNEMGFYLDNISILPKEVELPLKDIRLHNDEASRYRLADYFNSKAWTNEPVKICSTKELEKTATKASDPIR